MLLSALAARDGVDVDAAVVGVGPFAELVSDVAALAFEPSARQVYEQDYSSKVAAEEGSADSVDSSAPPELVRWPGGGNVDHDEVGELRGAQEVLKWPEEWRQSRVELQMHYLTVELAAVPDEVYGLMKYCSRQAEHAVSNKSTPLPVAKPSRERAGSPYL